MKKGFFGSLGDGFTATSADELQRLLARVEAGLPRRTQGRRPADRERYCIVHYLRTLAHNGLLGFPFEIVKSERPDFDVLMGSRLFGLEVTEAGSEESQQATTALEKAPPGSVLEGTVVREPGELLQGDLYGGDEPERLWTTVVAAAIREKTEKLATYRELPDCHLLVYDNSEFAALTAWTVTELPGRLAAVLRDGEDGGRAGDRHFRCYSVLRDRVLMYDVGGSAFLLPVPAGPSLPPLLPLTRLGVSEEPLLEFCRRHHIRKLGFFGSVRSERFGPHSDVDVLVEFEPSLRVGLLRLAGVELELSRLLGREADLRTVPDLSRYFRDEVVREKTDLAYAYDAA